MKDARGNALVHVLHASKIDQLCSINSQKCAALGFIRVSLGMTEQPLLAQFPLCGTVLIESYQLDCLPARSLP